MQAVHESDLLDDISGSVLSEVLLDQYLVFWQLISFDLASLYTSLSASSPYSATRSLAYTVVYKVVLIARSLERSKVLLCLFCFS